jgi:hypothetical protein
MVSSGKDFVSKDVAPAPVSLLNASKAQIIFTAVFKLAANLKAIEKPLKFCLVFATDNFNPQTWVWVKHAHDAHDAHCALCSKSQRFYVRVLPTLSWTTMCVFYPG